MKQKKRLHFGVLLSSIDNVSQCKIWEGIVDFAKKHDINLTAYLGTYQSKDESFDAHYETCFDAIKRTPLDGLIMFSGFIAEDIGIEIFKAHIDKLHENLPLVSVSFPIEGVASVLVDNEKGIFDAVEHLIKKHSKNKIVFVKGPDGHPEAEARLLGYKKALAENGLVFDKNYVLNGRFSRDSGQEAMVELLDKRNIEFDAVVVSDDETTFGVIKELEKRQILVPTNVAITGFDDEYESEMNIPSLSTARQPFFEIGKISAETLFDSVSGKITAETCLVSPEFIARQSCGCLEEFVSLSLPQKTAPNSESRIYPYVLQKFTELFPKNVPVTQVHSWATVLVEEMTEDSFSRKKFLHLFNEILIFYRCYSRDFEIWHEAVSILFDGIVRHETEIVNVSAVFSTLNSASTLIYNMVSKEDRSKVSALGFAQWLIRKSTNKLVLTFDFDALSEQLKEFLPELSIDMAFIGLYEQPIQSGNIKADRTVHRIIGFNGEKKINLMQSAKNPILFTDYSTITGFDFEQELQTMFFVPLFFNDEELGAMILPYSDENSGIYYWKRRPFDVYEALRVSISTAIKGAELIEKVRTLSITDELTGLYNRRGFYQFSYARIPYLSRHNEISPVVLFIDMDGLKHINDTYGHKEGDKAIAICAILLKEVLRDEDILGRIGGDEFVAFSSVKEASNSEDMIRRIRKKFEEYNAKKKHPYLVSCSVGAVVLNPCASQEAFDAAVQSADDILYAEKKEKKEKGLSRQ